MGSNIKCLILIFVVKVCISIKVNNGGYEDVYIFIREGVEENDNLIRRIKEVFTEASSLMLTATENRLYLKNIRIVVPKSWSKKPEYLNIPAPSLSRQYIILDKIIAGMTTPHVRSTGVCGAEGSYMFLSSTDFILKGGYTRWGSHDHVIVHEWAHLRWGVFDEYPISTKFYQGSGKWIPVRCTTQIKGKIGIGKGCSSNDIECDISNTGKKISDRCKFCPIEQKDNSASLMGYSFFNSIKSFCDKDDLTVNSEQRHNRQAPNRHNIVCKYKSVWEVMRKHIDFKDNTLLPPDTNTVPNFEIIQSSNEIHRVFVLDVSGSMKGLKLTILQQTCRYVIQDVIPQGSWLGIVTFSSSASTTTYVKQINSQADKDALKSGLPSVASGSTCIGCGIEEAIKILKINLESAENTGIVLISDGLNNRGNIRASIQKAVSEKVIVNTIAVSQEADSILAEIAQDTGGKHYTYLDKGSISFAATFSESIKDDHTMSASQLETVSLSRSL
ncbi:calcium-activated chloride channel regulator 1-like [Ruditapes philippinarum]|uniref:calcium-activated chloride channel regulator 1-like n=1 Tax=Ruditapes philippinarum TaxID=129788 RepID=UPI00295BC1B8|nr:calcium-activated chloride channel regulator 1-like [Ruditapes philippinarum]